MKHLPNILSSYRLLSFPFVLYLALSQQESYFVFFLCFNLITDILDGLIARAFNLQTELGARLDSIADLGTYLLAFVGILQFQSEAFYPYRYSFGIFIALFIIAEVLPLIKFGRMASMHLYSWKIGGYIQGIFFFVLFVFGFNTPFYYFMITWGILAFLEHITIQLVVKEMKSNSKGLYWVLKSRNNS